MSESDMRSKVIRLLKPLDAVAVENRVGPGTPDVNFIGGWVELKWWRSMPAKPDTPATLDHYTKIQKLWLKRRQLKGEKTWVLAQCKREWWLFDYPNLLEVGEMTRIEMIEKSFSYWANGINREELITCLKCQTQND